MQIKIFTKFLYRAKNEQGLIEEHYYDILIEIGHKHQVCLVSIIREYYAKILVHADLIYYSKI